MQSLYRGGLWENIEEQVRGEEKKESGIRKQTLGKVLLEATDECEYVQ